MHFKVYFCLIKFILQAALESRESNMRNLNIRALCVQSLVIDFSLTKHQQEAGGYPV